MLESGRVEKKKPRKDGDDSRSTGFRRGRKEIPSPSYYPGYPADCNRRGRLDIGGPRSEQGSILIIDHSRGQRAFAAAEVEGPTR